MPGWGGASAVLARADHRLGRFLPAPVRQELVDRYRWHRQKRGLVSWKRRPAGRGRRRLRVGFVGAGTYAHHHLKVLASLPDVSITSLLTTGGPRAEAAVSTYGIDAAFVDPEAFVGQASTDCFVVVVPATQMTSVVGLCLSAGKPVLLEKPPGISAADTAQLAERAQRHGTFGMVGMNRRYYSVIAHGLATLAECGPLRGAMLEAPQPISSDRAASRLDRREYDHFFIRNSIHGVDLLRHILGDPTHVHSLAWPNREFGNAAASFASLWEYDSGLVATTTDLWDTPAVWRLKVVAEQGWVEFEPFERGWFVNHRGWKARLGVDPLDRRFRTGLYLQDSHFCDAVRNGEPPSMPACLLADAHRTMLLAEQILAGNGRLKNTAGSSNGEASQEAAAFGARGGGDAQRS